MSREFPSKSALRDQKRRKREAEFAVENDKRRAEERRKDNLTMYERIAESDASTDVKEILHRLLEMIEGP